MTRTTDVFMKINIHYRLCTAQFLLECEVFRKNVVEKIEKRISHLIIFFLQNHAFYETMREKNSAQPESPQMKIRRMRFALWTPKAKKTYLRIINSYCFFTATMVTRNLLAVTSYINPLKTKRRLLYLKTQFVPRSKHFSSRL